MNASFKKSWLSNVLKLLTKLSRSETDLIFITSLKQLAFDAPENLSVGFSDDSLSLILQEIRKWRSTNIKNSGDIFSIMSANKSDIFDPGKIDRVKVKEAKGRNLFESRNNIEFWTVWQ